MHRETHVSSKILSKRITPSLRKSATPTPSAHEFWLVRALAKVIDYSEYRHCLPVVERAKEVYLHKASRG